MDSTYYRRSGGVHRFHGFLCGGVGGGWGGVTASPWATEIEAEIPFVVMVGFHFVVVGFPVASSVPRQAQKSLTNSGEVTILDSRVNGVTRVDPDVWDKRQGVKL